MHILLSYQSGCYAKNEIQCSDFHSLKRDGRRYPESDCHQKNNCIWHDHADGCYDLNDNDLSCNDFHHQSWTRCARLNKGCMWNFQAQGCYLRNEVKCEYHTTIHQCQWSYAATDCKWTGTECIDA